MDDARPLDLEELLAHVSWVRRLARALVRDAHAAEDLAQETLRVTLDQPRGRVGAGARLHRWLESVVRRLALDHRRADASRRVRETAAAPREPLEDTFEIVARSARQQRVVHAVHDLAEPYRATILYRYLDELPTREVAARMGVGVDVVQKRLQRGLAQLRSRLDAEFGSETKRWAIALLGWPGVFAMGAKVKVAIAATAVLVAALAWQELQPRRSSTSPTSIESTAVPITGASEGIAARSTAGDDDSNPKRELASTDRHQEATGLRSLVSDDETILHVTVLGGGGRPCTKGRLVGFWSVELRPDEMRPRDARGFEVDLAGERTDVVVPVRAGSALVAASVEGKPARSRWIRELRPEVDPGSRHGRVERDVTIQLLPLIAHPRLSGRILVDGVPRVPRGFDIELTVGLDLRVHALDACYQAAPMPWMAKSILVTSEETAPRVYPIAFDPQDKTADRTLDLDLSTGRTIVLHVRERRTGRPLPDVELFASVAIPGADSLWDHRPESMRTRGNSHFVTTDTDGVALVSGLPRVGSLELRREASQRYGSIEAVHAGTLGAKLGAPRLLRVELDDTLPDRIERTVAIDAEPRKLRVFGSIAPALLADAERDASPLEVRFSLVDAASQLLPDPELVTPVAGQWWQIPVLPDSDLRVWIERERRRVSEIARVRIDDASVGPIELVPRSGSELVVQFVHARKGDVVRLSVPDPAVAPHACDLRVPGETFERTIQLDAPARIEVRFGPTPFTWTTRRFDVDPATTSRLEVDLASAPPRRLNFTWSLGDFPVEARLHLLSLTSGDEIGGGADLWLDLFTGRGHDPIGLAPGRYLYVLDPPAPNALVAGVIDVDDGPLERGIAIHCELEPHDRAGLGAGVELERVGTTDLPESLRRATTRRFAEHGDVATGEPFLLPVGAEWTILTK